MPVDGTVQPSTILVVDDNFINIQMLVDVLSEWGYRVAIAKNGEAALQRIQSHHPDIILLDVMMPKIDGFSVCQRIKANPATQDIPVIFMTALSDSVDKVKGLRLGAVDYITKPIQHEEALARIRVHLQLRDSQKKLKDSEERLRLALAAAKQGIYDLNVQTGAAIVSPDYAIMLGYDPDTFQETHAQWIERIHPDDRDEIIRTYQAYVAGTIPDYRVEFRQRTQKGDWKWILSLGKIVEWDQASAPLRMLGTHTDINDLKQAELEICHLNGVLEQQNHNLEALVAERTAVLMQRTAQLEVSNHELESFSYSVSHDLRAPLRHIHGFISALQQRLENHGAMTDPKVAHYLQVIESSSQKMGVLIDGLLTLSRLGRHPMTYQPVPLNRLVEEAIALNQCSSQTTIPVEFVIGDLPTVQGDAPLLQQVLSNLISNAVKFSRNHPTPRIEIGTLTDGTVFVRDNGVGFQMEYADKLFGAFQRLHTQQEFEGTGIGLAIVQRIIHRHGGRIWAESQPNQGATFYFTVGSGS